MKSKGYLVFRWCLWENGLDVVVVVVLMDLFYCGWRKGGELVLKWSRCWTFVGG